MARSWAPGGVLYVPMNVSPQTGEVKPHLDMLELATHPSGQPPIDAVPRTTEASLEGTTPELNIISNLTGGPVL